MESNHRELTHIISKVIQISWDRHLVEDVTNVEHLQSLYENVGGLAGHIAGDGSDLRNHVGKVLLTVINVCEQNGTSIESCLNLAYADIKDNPPIRRMA